MVGPEHVQVFLSIGNGIALYDFPFRIEHYTNDDLLVGEWKCLAMLPALFVDGFHVAAAEGAYFFVTDAGAVYSGEEIRTIRDKAGRKMEGRDATQPAPAEAQRDKGGWKTGVVWKDAKRPIIAMLVESDGQTAWVFGKDFYFKVAKKPEVKSCRDVTKGRPDLGEPMRTVFECGRVLYEKGELKKAEAK